MSPVDISLRLFIKLLVNVTDDVLQAFAVQWWHDALRLETNNVTLEGTGMHCMRAQPTVSTDCALLTI